MVKVASASNDRSEGQAKKDRLILSSHLIVETEESGSSVSLTSDRARHRFPPVEQILDRLDRRGKMQACA